MHAVIKVLNLLELAVPAARLALTKSPAVILKNALLRAELPHFVSMMANDLDCSAVTRRQAIEVAEPGAITLDAARFAKVVATFPKDESVTIDTNGNTATVSTSRSRLQFNTLPELDYPPQFIANGEGLRQFEIGPDQRRHLFALPSVAIAAEDTRYYLTGICLQTIGAKLFATATNGYFLFQTRTDLPSGSEGLNVIVPRRACTEIAKLEGLIRIDNKVIETGNESHRFCHKLTDAAFPDWRPVVPAPSSCKVEIACAELLQALYRLAAFGAHEKVACAVGLEWTEGGELNLCLPDKPGAADEAIGATCSASGFVALNISYLQSLLSALDAERAVFDVGSPGAPMRIEVPGEDSVLALQMPMRWRGRAS
jgi:DNA polymerase-3 subunit beta